MFRIETGQHDDEFVATQPRDRIALAHRADQPLRNRLQQLVAGVVAQRVVDAFEMIKVEEEAPDVRAVALRQREKLLQPLIEQRPVRQASQDIFVRCVTLSSSVRW